MARQVLLGELERDKLDLLAQRVVDAVLEQVQETLYNRFRKIMDTALVIREDDVMKFQQSVSIRGDQLLDYLDGKRFLAVTFDDRTANPTTTDEQESFLLAIDPPLRR